MATKRENNVKSWDRIKNDPVRLAAENERKQCETCGDFFAGAGRHCSNACKDEI